MLTALDLKQALTKQKGEILKKKSKQLDKALNKQKTELLVEFHKELETMNKCGD